jgi:hypothetical protein
MNVEFHYYIIHFLALRAGIPENHARIIAYSSQYVDNNIVAYAIDMGREIYHTIVTQNYGWWDDSFPKNVYIPFHFFPGNNENLNCQRKDGKRNPLNCTPNSPGVKKLLIRALKTRNMYRVGIGLHTFADSWAHQNFSGTLETWNMISEDSPIPNIGHAQALKTPDDISVNWTDTRLTTSGSLISNRERFLQAALKIYKYLCIFNHKSFYDTELVMQELFTRLIPPESGKGLEERILDFIIETNIQEYDRKEWLRDAVYMGKDTFDEELFTGYDKLLWLRDALLYRTSLFKRNRLLAKNNFYQSHIYYWNEAAKFHLQAAHEISRQIGLSTKINSYISWKDGTSL